MHFIVSLFLFSLTLFALPPIEGGKPVPLTDTSLIDVVDLSTDRAICSGVKVSPVLVLTAAHCVVDLQTPNYKQSITKGSMIGMHGVVSKIHVHPKYVESHKKYQDAIRKLETEKYKKLGRDATLYDIAFIEFEPKKNVNREFPAIINKDIKFDSREEMILSGFGNTRLTWTGEHFEHSGSDSRQRMGTNHWENCQGALFDKSVLELEKLSNELDEFLEIKATTIHTVVGGMDYTENLDNKAMILGGDSGSPSLEKDVNGKLVVTGIASNISPFTEGSGEPELVIEVRGKIIREKLDKMPEDWGKSDKKDHHFPEVMEIMKKHNLLDSLGNISSDAIVRRQYKRVTTGRYSDLSHPENQHFIQSVMPPK